MLQTLHVAAVCVIDSQGRILSVRKQGTSAWMQPGGKLERGETALACALRELREELGLEWDATRLAPAGRWEGLAANEADTGLVADLFVASWDATKDGKAAVAAELAESLWMEPERALLRDDLAPLLRQRILPALVAGEWDALGAARA